MFKNYNEDNYFSLSLAIPLSEIGYLLTEACIPYSSISIGYPAFESRVVQVLKTNSLQPWTACHSLY
jgi:hypothetical protein